MKCKYCVQSSALEIGCEGGILFGRKYRQSFICGLYSYGSAAVQMLLVPNKDSIVLCKHACGVGGALASCRWDNSNSKGLSLSDAWWPLTVRTDRVWPGV